MRLFIGFDVPEERIKEINEKIEDKGIKRTKEFHCTLKFLGEVEDEKVRGIVERLKRIKFKKFYVELGNVGFFPNEDYIKVIYLEILGQEVNKLREEIEKSLEGIFPREERFKAHVTLGRVKFIENKEELKEIKKLGGERERYLIDSFKLVKSELRREGPFYENIEVFKSQD